MAETTAGAPSAAQTGIALVDRVIAAVNAATKIDNATSKPETYHVCRKLITNAAGAVLLDAATCDKVERLVQTLHLSVLAAEVDEAAKAASRLEMQQLRATIQSMKASTESTAAARAPPAVAPRTEPAVAPPAVVAPPPSEVPTAAAVVALAASVAPPSEPANATAAAPVVAPPDAKKTKEPTKKRPRAAAASSPSNLRGGAWLKAEVAFALMAKDHFEKGLLPASFAGLKLRETLAKLLKCDPMRVSKRADLGGSGGKTYKVAATEQELEAAASERAPLKVAFDAACLDPRAPKAPSAPRAPKKQQASLTAAVVKAATETLVAALDKAKLALGAADDATKAKAYDALRKAITQAEGRASIDESTDNELLRVGMELLAAKNYKPGSFRTTKSKLQSDIKALCPKLKPAPAASPPAASPPAATKQLEEAAAVARRAVDAADGHEAALHKLAPAVKAASAVVPTSASVWKGVGEAAALLRSKALPDLKQDRKGYKRVDDFVRNNIRKHLPDETLPKVVGALRARSQGTRADPERSGLVIAADGPLIVDSRDFDELALDEDDDGDVASILREPITIDAAAAARREEKRKENRLRAVQADEDDQRSPEERRRALEAVTASLMRQLEAVSASDPDADAGIYIGIAIKPRGAPLDGSLGAELFDYYLRDNCALLCADTGLRLNMDQLRLLHASGALVFVRSVHDQNPALVGDCENTAQVLGRRMVPPGRGQRIPFYGLAAYGGVDDMDQPALLYASVLWFDKAREAGIEVCLGQVSIVTERSLALSNETSFLGRPVGDNAGAFRRAMEALSSPVAAAASGASVTCLARPPPYGLERGWSFWGIAGVGHHVFVVWFVEGSRIHCKRVNFCEGGERLALAMYMQLRRAKLRDARGRLVCSSLPLEPGFVVGKLSDDVEEVDPGDEDLVECLLSLDDEPPALAVAPRTVAGDVLEGLYQGDLLELDESNATVSVAAAAPEPVLAPEPEDAEMTVAPPARKRSQPAAEPPAPKRPRAAAPFKPRGPRRNPGGLGGQMMRRQTGLLGYVEEWPRHVLPRHVFGDITNPRLRED